MRKIPLHADTPTEEELKDIGLIALLLPVLSEFAIVLLWKAFSQDEYGASWMETSNENIAIFLRFMTK